MFHRIARGRVRLCSTSIYIYIYWLVCTHRQKRNATADGVQTAHRTHTHTDRNDWGSSGCNVEYSTDTAEFMLGLVVRLRTAAAVVRA